jgi:murein L,D-transpeptidase YcbB/YkuD
MLAIAVLIFLFSADANAQTSGNSFYEDVKGKIKIRLEQRFGSEGFVCHGVTIVGIQTIPNFYENRNYTPAWFDERAHRPKVYAMIQAIRNASGDGLTPSDYHLSAIEELLALIEYSPFPPSADQIERWADLDLILSDSLLLLGSHLFTGRVNPETLHPDWIVAQPVMDLMALLNGSNGENKIEALLNALRPSNGGYAELRSALERMRIVVAEGGWPPVAEGPKLEPNRHDQRVPVLRRRLSISGDLTAAESVSDSDFYDEDLAQAVRRFQTRHGIEPDGVIGQRTIMALNVTAEQRVRQIELNLERMRWLPKDLGSRHIAVNTADFRLEVIEKGRPVLEMPVVVGRPARRTPIFSAQMTYLVLNPFWSVPHTIATEDILPRLKAGENYLEEHNIQIFEGWDDGSVELDPKTIDWHQYSKRRFPFQLRQNPGPQNSLGQIKFMFPNKFSVYLHDTPQRSLFKKVQRDFSSGCIRVQNAPALAEYLLRDNPGWTEARLKSAIQEGGSERVIVIRNPLPVHLLYLTSWVDRQEVLNFRNDIYDRDPILDSALQQHRATPRPPLASILGIVFN